jgi:hypothetical protein
VTCPVTPTRYTAAMAANRSGKSPTDDDDWLAFHGGELEGRRPTTRCPACRQFRAERTGRRPLCFHCYRADFERTRALRAAGELQTGSEGRFQFLLPFEPVNRPRLIVLKTQRATARASMRAGSGRFAGRVHLAQIAARRALQVGTASRARPTLEPDRNRPWQAAVHADDLRLPESWLPFVVAR